MSFSKIQESLPLYLLRYTEIFSTVCMFLASLVRFVRKKMQIHWAVLEKVSTTPGGGNSIFFCLTYWQWNRREIWVWFNLHAVHNTANWIDRTFSHFWWVDLPLSLSSAPAGISIVLCSFGLHFSYSVGCCWRIHCFIFFFIFYCSL